MGELAQYLRGQGEHLLMSAAAGPDAWRLDVLATAPKTEREEALRILVEAERPLRKGDIPRLQALLQRRAGAVQLTDGALLAVRDDVLERRRATEQTAFDPVEARPGEYRLPGGFGLRLRLVEGDDCEETIKFAQRAKKPFDNCADYDKISSSLCLRTRQPGDVYRPAGRNVDKTLKKLFNEKKEPAFRRGALPLLAAGSRVVWLWGEGFAHGLRPDERTRRLLVVEPLDCEHREEEE